MDFWWCLTHGRVEEGPGCPNKERLGPYATHERAATALDRTRARTAEQDALDEAEEGRDPG
ncbi:MAG: hypothetical protein WD794_05005 [Mycobacteriales bacterium]